MSSAYHYEVTVAENILQKSVPDSIFGLSTNSTWFSQGKFTFVEQKGVNTH